jgi:hypothetical protein
VKIRTLILGVILILIPCGEHVNASTLPSSDPFTTSFSAVVDSGTSQNRVSGGQTNILPVCSSGEISWCIESLEVKVGAGDFNSAKFVRYVDNGNRPSSSSNSILENKSAISIWSIRNSMGDVDEYAIQSVLENGFSSAIYEIKEIKSLVRDDIYGQMSPSSGDYRLLNPGYLDDCVFVSQGICGQRVSLKGSVLRLTEYIGKEYSSWFAGRLAAGSYSITPASEGQSKLVVTGAPEQVPEVLQESAGVDRYSATGCTDPVGFAASHPHLDQVTLDSLCAQWKADYERCFPSGSSGSPNELSTNCPYTTRMETSYFNIAPFMNNTSVLSYLTSPNVASTIEPYIWSFQSESFTKNSECLSGDGFLGSVSTNALVFDAYPPLLINGALTYHLISPHLDSSGELNSGIFEVQLNSSTLRCLYNFTNAPISASVTITNENGSTNVSTSTWSEKDGISRLSISGFHFSSPNIIISFSQNAGSIEEKNSTAPISKKIQQVSTIVCKKGKSSKKITGVSPACPKGYVKR